MDSFKPSDSFITHKSLGLFFAHLHQSHFYSLKTQNKHVQEEATEHEAMNNKILYMHNKHFVFYCVWIF